MILLNLMPCKFKKYRPTGRQYEYLYKRNLIFHVKLFKLLGISNVL